MCLSPENILRRYPGWKGYGVFFNHCLSPGFLLEGSVLKLIYKQFFRNNYLWPHEYLFLTCDFYCLALDQGGGNLNRTLTEKCSER